MQGELPSFRTPRFLLRPRSPADLQSCLAMDRDPEVTRFIPGPWHDPVAHRSFVLDRMHRAYPAGMGYWSIIAARGFIGWILLTPLDLRGPEIEIGWRLVRAAWGHGYASEAGLPILQHAFSSLALPKVIADIHRANSRSIAVARKLGMRCEGPTSHNNQLDRFSTSPVGDAD